MIVPKKLTNNDSHSIQMSSQLFTHLQLKNTRDINISVGQITIPAKVQTIEISGNEIHLPEHILKAFCLPLQTITFQAMYWAKTHTLKLGPVIGLLTDFPENENEEPHFRSIHLFCEELHHGITAQGGFFYVFSYDKFTNQGYYLENGKWNSAQLPLPDVIYNRIHSRMLEHKKPFKQFRQQLEQKMIPFFNDRFLSKWEVYEQLKSENHLYAYIPETKLFSKENFQEFTQTYNSIFLKPIHGSQGRNIIKVMKEQGSLYSFQTSLPGLPDNLEKKYSLEELYQQIKPLLRNGIYIIQQGIALVSTDSSSMDFRILCHKDINNQWVVTSTVARIAAEQEFVSNIARGGTMTRPLYALRTCMSHNKSLEVLRLIKELALETASVISKHSGGIMGELGIDIGVDLEGKPWLIEVNSKPSKKFEDGLVTIRPSTKAIIQFCTKLAFD